MSMRCASSSPAAALYHLLLLQNKYEAFAAAVIDPVYAVIPTLPDAFRF
jgi:hypothetical protein